MGKLIMPPGFRRPPFVAGRWYIAYEHIATAAALSANTIRLTPFPLDQPVTMSDLATYIATAAASGNLALAIYAADQVITDPTGLPVAATGSISTASTGAVSADITGANPFVPAGEYWMAVNADTNGAGCVCQGVASSAALGAKLRGSTTLGNLANSGSSSVWALTIAQTFGTWPDLTGQTFSENTSQRSAMLYFKAA